MTVSLSGSGGSVIRQTMHGLATKESETRMGKRPTTPFGHIAFGKDGSVKPKITLLSLNKDEQEFAVAEAFLELCEDLCAKTASVRQLEENNHDFEINVGNSLLATVQCTEIIYRDFLVRDGRPSSESILIDGALHPVDLVKRDSLIREKIEHKLRKHYAKPKVGELWLVIWTVTGYPSFGRAWTQGGPIDAESVQQGRKFVKENRPGPFDRIYTFNMLTRPTLVWPA